MQFGRWSVRVEWKLEDLWIGAFWRKTPCLDADGNRKILATEIWICLIPCVPIHLTYWHDARLL